MARFSSSMPGSVRTRISQIVGTATSTNGLGHHFGGHLYEAEIRYLVRSEWAMTAEDILYRRTKEYLHMTDAEQTTFAKWFEDLYAQSA